MLVIVINVFLPALWGRYMRMYPDVSAVVQGFCFKIKNAPLDRPVPVKKFSLLIGRHPVYVVFGRLRVRTDVMQTVLGPLTILTIRRSALALALVTLSQCPQALFVILLANR